MPPLPINSSEPPTSSPPPEAIPTSHLAAVPFATPSQFVRTPESTPRTKETPRPIIDISERKLPGNYGWTGRISDAIEHKWLALKTFDQTYSDRAISGRKARTADTMQGNVTSLQRQREDYADNLDKIRGRIDELQNNDSFFSKLPIGRQINALRIRWNGFKASRWESDIRGVDAKLINANARWQRALDSKASHDERINAQISSAEQRLNDKLAPIERLRSQVDSSAERLATTIGNYEMLRTQQTEALDVLKGARPRGPQSPAQMQDRQQKISTARAELANTKRLLDNYQKKYARCMDHQVRLANAHSTAKAAKDNLLGRYYREAAKISRPEGGATTRPRETTTATEAPVLSTYREIIGSTLERGDATEVTPEQFFTLWNIAMPTAQIKEDSQFSSLKDLMNHWTQSFPDGTKTPIEITDEQKEKGFKTIGEWRAFIEELYNANDDFRSFVDGEGILASDAINRVSTFAANKIGL